MNTKRSELGAALAEYAISVALVSILALTAMQELGFNLADSLCKTGGYIVGYPSELSYNARFACCGYEGGHFGVSFTCSF